MEEKRKEIRRKLWNSLEMGEVKRNLLIFLIAFPLLAWFATGRVYQPEAKLFMLGITAVLLLPYLLFYGVRMFNILHRPEHYVFCQTTLEKPHASLNHRRFYFSVVLTDEKGKVFMADTHGIFSTRGLFSLQMEDYVGRTVTVGYNPTTGMVVVIG